MLNTTFDWDEVDSLITLLQMNINIEFASPSDFFPLPTQWEARSEFIKRYHQVDVFLF